jgi:hypothetical protein
VHKTLRFEKNLSHEEYWLLLRTSPAVGLLPVLELLHGAFGYPLHDGLCILVYLFFGFATTLRRQPQVFRELIFSLVRPGGHRPLPSLGYLHHAIAPGPARVFEKFPSLKE